MGPHRLDAGSRAVLALDHPHREDLLLAGHRELDGRFYFSSQLRQLDPTLVGQPAFLGIASVAIALALAAIWGRRREHLHPLVAATGTITCAALLVTPAALLVDGVPAARPSIAAGLAMLCLSVLSTVCAYALFFTMLKRVGASNLVLINFMIPAVALTFGALVLSETLASSAFIGVASVAIALALADRRLLASGPRERSGRAPVVTLTKPTNRLLRKAVGR